VHLKTVRISNFRRLKNVSIDLETETTIFVGANNSGKTSAASALRLLVKGRAKDLTVYDFSASCLESLNTLGLAETDVSQSLPSIMLDLWFEVREPDLHRVVDLLPSLDWDNYPVGIRLEYGPKQGPELLARFRAAKSAAAAKEDGSYHPWPTSLQDFLEKRLHAEYELSYSVLEHPSPEALPGGTYDPTAHSLSNSKGEAAATLDSLLTLDFLDAQRFLSDSEANARTHDLSRSLSQFYQRNLDQFETDTSVLQALHASENSFNEHLAQVFQSTLNDLNTLGYPGIENPDLVIKSSFTANQIMAQDTAVRYSLPRADGEGAGLHLPEKYNGLGFKNLIYMVIRILDFHQRWSMQEERTPVHLVIVEEPEAHLHAQLQQVFISKMRDIISDASGLTTQLVVTTHSAHVINESKFTPIRYFRRTQSATGRHETQVRDVSRLNVVDNETVDFLERYMKLTHCDLFFADAVILVEGNVERLLMPSIIEKTQQSLTSNYLTILEVGGAFAHKFDPLINLLGIPTLVITDLDSVSAKPSTGAALEAGAPTQESAEDDDEDGDEDEDASPGSRRGKACRADEALAVTSNPTLKNWHPRKTLVQDLLNLGEEEKEFALGTDGPARVRVAYETPSPVVWNGADHTVVGRTFEETFAYENLEWVLHDDQRALGFLPSRFDSSTKTLDEIAAKIHKRIATTSFKKTEFALALMLSTNGWNPPSYIANGLAWLDSAVNPPAGESKTGNHGVELS
jgi:predicted ATP-dependent endonuclease of OLD family